MGDDEVVNGDSNGSQQGGIGKMPVPQVNPEPETAPGGADASATINDPGAGGEGKPVTPDQPLSAQTEGAEVPDEIRESEGPDETIDDSAAEPEVHPTD